MRKSGLAALITFLTAAPAFCAGYNDLNSGIRYHNQGQWTLAISRFDTALAAGDLVPSLQFVAYLDRASARYALKQYNLAIEDYSSSLRLRPADPAALAGRMRAYLNSGMTDRAADDLDTLVAARPHLRATYEMRAAVNARRGLKDKSAEDMKMVQSLLSKDKPGFARGIVAWQQGRFADAEEDFSYVLRKYRKSRYTWLWLALARMKQGREPPDGFPPSADMTIWPGPLVELFLGKTTQEAAFAAARDADAELAQMQVCEANFYAGAWLMQHDKAADAKRLLENAFSDCPTGMLEWVPAQLELTGLP